MWVMVPRLDRDFLNSCYAWNTLPDERPFWLRYGYGYLRVRWYRHRDEALSILETGGFND